MNEERRKKINKCTEKIETSLNVIKEIKDEEEYAYDNIPENLKYSLIGERSEECIDILDDVCEGLEEACDKLREI